MQHGQHGSDSTADPQRSRIAHKNGSWVTVKCEKCHYSARKGSCHNRDLDVVFSQRQPDDEPEHHQRSIAGEPIHPICEIDGVAHGNHHKRDKRHNPP